MTKSEGACPDFAKPCSKFRNVTRRDSTAGAEIADLDFDIFKNLSVEKMLT